MARTLRKYLPLIFNLGCFQRLYWVALIQSSTWFEPLRRRLDVIPFGAIDASVYLRSVDFWVYFHSEDWTEHSAWQSPKLWLLGWLSCYPIILNRCSEIKELFTARQALCPNCYHVLVG